MLSNTSESLLFVSVVVAIKLDELLEVSLGTLYDILRDDDARFRFFVSTCVILVGIVVDVTSLALSSIEELKLDSRKFQ